MPISPSPGLCPSRRPVDMAGVSVGHYLRHNPGGQPNKSLGQGMFDPEDSL